MAAHRQGRLVFAPCSGCKASVQMEIVWKHLFRCARGSNVGLAKAARKLMRQLSEAGTVPMPGDTGTR